MTQLNIEGRIITQHCFGTVIIGAGAAAMNCAKKLCEYLEQKGIPQPHRRIVVVTAGLALGVSRMSGSDKQTYYKMGTSPDVPDSARSFAESLTAAGCCHEDLALAEAAGSLRGFYNLLEAGVPFPCDSAGSYIGYKTDHDPYERATSAGPKTSKFMSECLEKIVKRCGVAIFDHQELVELLTTGSGAEKRITAAVTIDRKKLSEPTDAVNIFCAENFVLAAGGPGRLYKTSVYPKGQTGVHGIAFRAGLVAENLTESQFGLASIGFRWNVSGTYMQVIPRIFSTDRQGRNEKDFLADFFPTMRKMASNIFLKGYQWPFDPQKIENFQSSLIDVLVFNETQNQRRVFMDFLRNPIGNKNMAGFSLDDLDPEALNYLKSTGATQATPIERLARMNPLAIEIYKEHGIDLHTEPLEIALCAQHNNGGFAVNKWWQSNISNTFVIGEMAGTHGVKRPGGSALNAGQVGAQRAAEFIAHSHSDQIAPPIENNKELLCQIQNTLTKLDGFDSPSSDTTTAAAIDIIQSQMTAAAGHIRNLTSAENALNQILALYNKINAAGFKLAGPDDLTEAIQAHHLCLAAAAYLRAVLELLKTGSGSRGSHLVTDPAGIEIHPDIKDPLTGKTLKYKPENNQLRGSILSIRYNPESPKLFDCFTVPVRKASFARKAFEIAWDDYRKGIIYKQQ